MLLLVVVDRIKLNSAGTSSFSDVQVLLLVEDDSSDMLNTSKKERGSGWTAVRCWREIEDVAAVAAVAAGTHKSIWLAVGKVSKLAKFVRCSVDKYIQDCHMKRWVILSFP